VSAKEGLSTIIAQRVELSDAIQETKIRNLSILPCGPLPPDPAELLVSPRFEQFLQVVREKFDYVLVDTPPLLAVTDPCVVAPRVDGVLLTVRISKHGRHQAERAKNILTSLEVKVLGVVVNGLDRTSSGSYGYGENYGYGQGYGDPDAAQQDALDPNAEDLVIGETHVVLPHANGSDAASPKANGKPANPALVPQGH